MKTKAIQLLCDKRIWFLLSLTVIVAFVPPGDSHAGTEAKHVVDSTYYYKVNVINYLKMQHSLIKKL